MTELNFSFVARLDATDFRIGVDFPEEGRTRTKDACLYGSTSRAFTSE